MNVSVYNNHINKNSIHFIFVPPANWNTFNGSTYRSSFIYLEWIFEDTMAAWEWMKRRIKMNKKIRKFCCHPKSSQMTENSILKIDFDVLMLSTSILHSITLVRIQIDAFQYPNEEIHSRQSLTLHWFDQPVWYTWLIRKWIFATTIQWNVRRRKGRKMFYFTLQRHQSCRMTF